MATALIILWAILGGLWRRAFGGWLGLSRVACYAMVVPLMIPAHMVIVHELWAPYAVMAMLATTGLALLFFVVSCYPGGRFDDDREVLLKYGPFGIFYPICRRYWPDSWRWGGFVDGWSSAAEIGLGASFWATVAAIAWVVW